jgi:hypothetical protein
VVYDACDEGSVDDVVRMCDRRVCKVGSHRKLPSVKGMPALYGIIFAILSKGAVIFCNSSLAPLAVPVRPIAHGPKVVGCQLLLEIP